MNVAFAPRSRDPLAQRALTTPDRLAIVDADAGDDADRERTYRASDAGADAVAAGLEAIGLESGDRIGVILDTRPAVAALLFAAMRLGVTIVALPVTETPTELASKVERTAPSALVCEADTERLALELAADEVPIVSVDEPRHAGVERLESVAVSRPEAVPFDLDRTLLLAFTSGTSGTPKAVRLTAGNLFASATASAFRLGVLPGDRWLCSLPAYHVGGLAPILRSTLYGTTVVFRRSFDSESTARVLEAERITGVSLVPTMLDRLLEAGWTPPESLRFVLLGGAPATEALLERADRAGVPVYPTYGATEAASQIATATPDAVRTRPGTVGQPLSATTVSIVADGELAGPNGTGEIVVSGPTVTPGYLDEERTAEAFSDRGFHTGDLGYRDEDGYLWVTGRTSDRIVTGGENVDPAEVRDALATHPAVRDAAVVGLPDEEWGERVSALVVPDQPSEPPTLESVRTHCRPRLAGFKRPKTIAFGEALPRTPSGTVDRDAVREHLERHGRDAS